MAWCIYNIVITYIYTIHTHSCSVRFFSYKVLYCFFLVRRSSGPRSCLS